MNKTDEQKKNHHDVHLSSKSTTLFHTKYDELKNTLSEIKFTRNIFSPETVFVARCVFLPFLVLCFIFRSRCEAYAKPKLLDWRGTKWETKLWFIFCFCASLLNGEGILFQYCKYKFKHVSFLLKYNPGESDRGRNPGIRMIFHIETHHTHKKKRWKPLEMKNSRFVCKWTERFGINECGIEIDLGTYHSRLFQQYNPNFIFEWTATDIKIASLITGIYKEQREKKKTICN